VLCPPLLLPPPLLPLLLLLLLRCSCCFLPLLRHYSVIGAARWCALPGRRCYGLLLLVKPVERGSFTATAESENELTGRKSRSTYRRLACSFRQSEVMR
jgi:hypothetical protein